MNKLMCFLTGSHKYDDTNLTVQMQANSDWATVHNKCIKCGKPFETEIEVGRIIREDMAKMKGGEE